jgi:hypothetical protein
MSSHLRCLRASVERSIERLGQKPVFVNANDGRDEREHRACRAMFGGRGHNIVNSGFSYLVLW